MENGMSDDRKAADVSLYYQTNKNMEERASCLLKKIWKF